MTNKLTGDDLKYEYFYDVGYYDQWAVRDINKRAFNEAFHVPSEAEAKALCGLLNAKDRVIERIREMAAIIYPSPTPPAQGGIRGAMKTVKCKCCKKPFEARVADIKRGWGKFCSKSCKAKKQYKEMGYPAPATGGCFNDNDYDDDPSWDAHKS